mmetsp:Transcript_74320/g.197430  ORF Transcript_74320/g.197430 Transcript_74320/m.197430 type:complete len:201 (-) Transcript_74320:75-677(-)
MPMRHVRISKLWVGCDSSGCMTWNIHLWQDLDVPLLSIGHDIADLVLGVCLVRAVCVLSAHTRQLRQHGHWQAPALIVCEVPVEAVQLEGSHRVEQALDVTCSEKVPAHVEVETTPLKARFVPDGHCREDERSLVWKQLLQGLNRIEQPSRCVCLQQDAAVVNAEEVALWVVSTQGELKLDAATCGVALHLRDNVPQGPH